MLLRDLFEDSRPARELTVTDSWWGDNRHWYHPKSGIHYTPPTFQLRGNHTSMVYEFPEAFGIPVGELAEPKTRDYDGPTLFRAMQNGWVRVMVDRRRSDYGSNIEGLWFAGLAATAAAMRNSTLTQIKQFAIIRRTGTGNWDGEVYMLSNIDQVGEFIETKRPPSGTKINVNGSKLV